MSMQETIQFFLVIISEEYLQEITCNNYTCIQHIATHAISFIL